MMNMQRQFLILTLLVLVAACGSSSKSTTPATTGTGGTMPGGTTGTGGTGGTTGTGGTGGNGGPPPANYMPVTLSNFSLNDLSSTIPADDDITGRHRLTLNLTNHGNVETLTLSINGVAVHTWREADLSEGTQTRVFNITAANQTAIFAVSMTALNFALTIDQAQGNDVSTMQAVARTDPPASATSPISLVRALPAGNVMINPNDKLVTFSHIGFADARISLRGTCPDFSHTSIHKSLTDLAASSANGMQVDPTSNETADQLITHRITCNFAASSSYTFTADATRPGGTVLRATHSISTGTASTGSITVKRTSTLTRDETRNIATNYVGGLLGDGNDFSNLNLDDSTIDIVLENILYSTLGERWDNIFTTSMTPKNPAPPRATYGVRSESVSYSSTEPDGTPSNELTGLIAYPDTTTPSIDFLPRDKMIVLLHATGSTPSELDSGDAWYIMANLLAGRGYLVVVPDNYGRGGTMAEEETYLMAESVARNAYDLIRLALADSDYDAIYDGSDADNRKVALVGYSQGAHSAISLLQLLATQAPDIKVTEVWAGGGPHSLYSTTLGYARSLTNSCNLSEPDYAYCNYPESAERNSALTSYVVNRVLPGLITYTNTGFTLGQLVTTNNNMKSLTSGVAAGVLGNMAAAYDALKIQMQLDNFPQITATSAAGNFGDMNTTVYLYHSQYDRLVPYDNSIRLERALMGAVTVIFDKTKCNTTGEEGSYEEAASSLTDFTGHIHAACALSMLNDVMDALK